MSTRTTLRPFAVIEDGSMAADITSDPTILQSLTKVSYALSWSGSTPVGTVAVQVSNDYALSPNGQEVLDAGTWTTLPLMDDSGVIVSSLPVTGNTGTLFVDVTTAAYAIRLFYDRTSGTGTLQATIVGKVA